MKKTIITVIFILFYSISHSSEMIVGGTQSAAVATFKNSNDSGLIATESNGLDLGHKNQNAFDIINPTKYTNYGYISISEEKERGLDWSFGFEASNAYLKEQRVIYNDESYQFDVGTSVFLRRYGTIIPIYYRFKFNHPDPTFPFNFLDIGYMFGINIYNFDGQIYFTERCVGNFGTGLDEQQLKSQIKSSCPIESIQSNSVLSTNLIFVSQGVMIKLGNVNDFGLHLRLTDESSNAASKYHEASIRHRFYVVGLGFTFSYYSPSI